MKILRRYAPLLVAAMAATAVWWWLDDDTTCRDLWPVGDVRSIIGSDFELVPGVKADPVRCSYASADGRRVELWVGPLDHESARAELSRALDDYGSHPFLTINFEQCAGGALTYWLDGKISAQVARDRTASFRDGMPIEVLGAALYAPPAGASFSQPIGTVAALVRRGCPSEYVGSLPGVTHPVLALSQGQWALMELDGESILSADRFSILDTTAYSDTEHAIETLGVLVGDCTNPDSEPPVELGTVTAATGEWTPVSLLSEFKDPVVVAGPASLQDTDPGVVAVRNITPTGFEVRFWEWDYLDGIHGTEQLSYVVAERGVTRLPSGAIVQAGTQLVTHVFEQVQFSAPLYKDQPVILTTVASANDGRTVAPRIRSTDRTDSRSHDGFLLRVQNQQSALREHGLESVNWIAWETGSDDGSRDRFAWETQWADIDHRFRLVQFAGSYDQPCLLTDMNSTVRLDPATVRYRHLTSGGVELQVDEEESETRPGAIGACSLLNGFVTIDGSNYDFEPFTYALNRSAFEPPEGLASCSDPLQEQDQRLFEILRAEGGYRSSGCILTLVSADGRRARFMRLPSESILLPRGGCAPTFPWI